MAAPRIGAVQARWGHLNADTNLLTRAQAMSIDMHFVVEQPTRDRAGLLLNFSGSAGVWRRACIEDAGGWRDVTLTEDLDLSYRAQLRGWRFAVLPGVEVPAELPPQVAAYKRQQARWAKGGTQCLRLHGPSILRAEMGRFKKVMALIHLGQRLSHPLLLVMMILTVPLMLDGMLEHLTLGVLGLLGFAPIIAFAISQCALYPRWPLHLLILPVLTVLGAGVTVNNTIAIISALRGRPNVFERTPKFGAAQWQESRYALLADKTVIGELALSLYAGLGVALAITHNKPATLPLFVTYALSCGGMALLTLLESRRVVRAPRHKQERSRQSDSSQMV